MSSYQLRPLTKRQQAVIERIDRRAPIKVIARDLGVSETRINQHIRALKDIYKAESLADLVEAYRVHKIADEEAPEPEKSEWDQNPKPEELALSESVYSKNQVPVGTLMSDQSGQDDPGELVIRDVSSMVDEAPWLRPAEPQVVPRVLDGDNAIWFRLAAIMGIAFGVLAALVLSVTAAITISEVLDGKAAIPVDEQGYS
ncbi:hypothetical protein [uncultured Erythrobacter sp.]|uniref:helix-turn-helix transcriptional regulator n=1 Tax=uncultured Erythrobacter sp. TaxID=263913 RepID=UPI0026346AEB|nr:hypothetical protein [uncultured Erythrobacter sp.]